MQMKAADVCCKKASGLAMQACLREGKLSDAENCEERNHLWGIALATRKTALATLLLIIAFGSEKFV